MQSILDAINEWIKEILIGAINGNLSTMFGDVNEKVGTIAAEVGQTPQGWNAGIFSMIQSLSENVIVPIAGLVITYVLCVELISMVTEKNNMHDIDTFMFFKWFFKAWVAVYLVTHTFTITMAVFDMAQHVVSGAAGVIGGDTNAHCARPGVEPRYRQPRREKSNPLLYGRVSSAFERGTDRSLFRGDLEAFS